MRHLIKELCSIHTDKSHYCSTISLELQLIMVLFISCTTIIHGILYTLDEYILHRKRNLSQKEINNSIIDGVLFLVIVGLTIFTTYSEKLATVYIILSILSCLSIVKNEIFYEDITTKERLVHALLYVFHPLILYAFFLSWQADFFITNSSYWMMQLCYFAIGFKVMSYHIIYWNYIHNK